MKRARDPSTSGADAFDMVNDVINQRNSTTPTPPTFKVGDMTLQKKEKTLPSPPPSTSSGSGAKNARQLLTDQLKASQQVLASISVQKMPEPEEKRASRAGKKKKYVRSNRPGVDIEEVEDMPDVPKKPNASYYKYGLSLRPCARDFEEELADEDGDEGGDPDRPSSKLEEKQRCFVCNWSNFTGYGTFADDIREFLNVYKSVKAMGNFAITASALAKQYMEKIYNPRNGMHPMTARMFYNCMRGGHVETYETWLENEIDRFKSIKSELQQNMYMANNVAHPDNFKALLSVSKQIDLFYSKLHKLRKDEETTGSVRGISGAPFSFSGITTKNSQARDRQNSAQQSKIKNMPNPF